MANSAIQSAGEWLGRLLVEEVRYLYGVRDKVEELQSELEWMQCFLLDADAKQHKNAVIRKWVSQMKDLAYEAEDTIEKFILTVSYHGRHDNFWSKVKWFLYCSRDAMALHEVGSDIDALVLKISKLTTRLQTYGIDTKHEETSSLSAMRLELRQSYSHLVEDDVVGIDNDIKKLATELVNDQHHKVIAIHGMGGLGKTTLARKVYHYHSVREHFSRGQAWACVSKQFQTRNVLLTILLQLVPENNEGKRKKIQELQDGQLPGELHSLLNENKYLVVLDDVWTTEDWECLQPAFQVTGDDSFGSKILITTRNRDILSGFDPFVRYYEPKLLGDLEAWKLLQKKAFPNTDTKIDPEMIEVGKEMLKHCKGLPLAIIVLGGVLAKKEKLDDWQNVRDNISQYFGRRMARRQSSTGVLDVLAMSYHDLDYHLKRCFLSLALFPEDFEIPAEKLYRIWIAEGMVDLEEDAEYYLNELVQKHVVQVGTRGSKGQIKTCHLHDLMRDTSLEIAKEEIFLQVIDHQGAHEQSDVYSASLMNEKLRRLAIYVGQDVKSSLPGSSSRKAPNIRSLLFFPVRPCKKESCGWMRSICNDFKLLRVLDFEGFNIEGRLPKEVGYLIYLRYLSLKGTHITKLPSSIINLRRLETLDLRVANVVLGIPNLLWKLQCLRYLFLPSRALSQELNVLKQGYKVKRDAMLRLDGLSNLETLKDVDMDRVDIKGLLELRNMRKLSATCCSRKESLEPFLKSGSINRLSLKIKGSVVSENPMMLSKCQSIHKLDIDDEISVPLSLEMFPKSLVKLGLWYCELTDDPMPILEKLPQLRSLGIHRGYYESTMICSAGGFPQLNHLMIDGISYLKEWRVEAGALPNLKKLEIYWSPIQMLPDTLPTSVDIACKPCVPGIERYMTCPYFKRQEDRGD